MTGPWLSKLIRAVKQCASQDGCRVSEKNQLWVDLSYCLSTIPKHESLLLGADLNGHVGKVRDDTNDCHNNRGTESATKMEKEFLNSQKHMAS